MNIGLCFNRNYLTPAFVLMTSIFKNNTGSFHFHMITDGLSESDKTRLQVFAINNKSEVSFYSVSMPSLHLPNGSYFSMQTYYRLFFAQLLQVDKLLYLDVDMVVIKDLQELYNTDISGHVLAAVQDPYFKVRDDLGLQSREDYFNTGMLLMNLNEWREQQITEKALNYTKANPEKLIYVDQDALNAVLCGNWMHLDKRYNLTRGDVPVQVPTREILKDTVIVHYNTSEKPWHTLSRNKLRFLYHYYLKFSPAPQKKYLDTGSIKDFLRIRIKEKYFDLGINKILRIPSWDRIKHDY